MHKHFHIPYKNLRVPKPLHGWSALLGEVFVIVLGVLIALSAEQLVQAIHWHEKTLAAESAMRIEMRDDNAPIAYIRLLIYPCVSSSAKLLVESTDRLTAAELRTNIAALKVPFDIYDSEAWHAVQSSDIANHVSAETLIEWSKPYRLMPTMSSKTARETSLQAELRAVLPVAGEATLDQRAEIRKIASELTALNNDVSVEALLLLQRLKNESIVLSDSQIRDLEAETRAEYGTCVQRPDLRKRFPLTHGLTDDKTSLVLNQYYSP